MKSSSESMLSPVVRGVGGAADDDETRAAVCLDVAEAEGSVADGDGAWVTMTSWSGAAEAEGRLVGGASGSAEDGAVIFASAAFRFLVVGGMVAVGRDPGLPFDFIVRVGAGESTRKCCVVKVMMRDGELGRVSQTERVSRREAAA